MGISPCYALGIQEALWHVTAEQAPNGAIGRMTNQDIAMEMFYDGNPEVLIQALLDADLLDNSDEHRLIVHDWHIHSDDATDNKLARSGQTYANGKVPRMRRLSRLERAHVTAQYAAPCESVRTESHEKPLPVPEPVPEPVPVKKEQKPSRDKREANPMHTVFKGLIHDAWKEWGNPLDIPWDGAEGKQLGMLIGANPKLGPDGMRRLLQYRARSSGVNLAERPSKWIRNLTDYARGPLNEFKQPQGASHGNRNQSKTGGNLDAATQAIAFLEQAERDRKVADEAELDPESRGEPGDAGLGRGGLIDLRP